MSRRLFTTAGRLMMPRALRHPVKELGKKSGRMAKKAGKAGKKGGRDVRKGVEKKVGRRNRLGLTWP